MRIERELRGVTGVECREQIEKRSENMSRDNDEIIKKISEIRVERNLERLIGVINVV